MKVLIDHDCPFFLAHGGLQIQIEQTRHALESAGLDVDYVQWWNAGQTGDVIHYFGRPQRYYVEFAHQKDQKVVLAELLTGLGARPAWARWLQQMVTIFSQYVVPRAMLSRMAWDTYQAVDAIVMGTAWEAHLATQVFSAPPARVHVVPNGVEPEFLHSQPVTRGPWLVCTATITERKRIVELATAAVHAQTPVWIIGKPYAEGDPYALRFFALAQQHPEFIRYEGALSDRRKLAQAYREARGFVLLSTKETLSLSSFEAAACECPLLLSDLPWAHSAFQQDAWYCPVTRTIDQTARVLRRFYDQAPRLKAPKKPQSWPEIGEQFKRVYEGLFRTSR